jgi:hypothetical protein
MNLHDRMHQMQNQAGPFICGKVGALLLAFGTMGSYLLEKVAETPHMLSQAPVPNPPNARTLAEWMPWLVAGGFMLIATQIGRAISSGISGMIELYIAGKKKIRDADSDTAQAKLESCEKLMKQMKESHDNEMKEYVARHQNELHNATDHCNSKIRDLEETVKIKENEIANCYVRIAQRDAQIKHHIDEKTKILDNNIKMIEKLGDWTNQVTRSNVKLTDQIIEHNKIATSNETKNVKIVGTDAPVPVVPSDDTPFPVITSHNSDPFFDREEDETRL